jgi:hypothetical protein
MFLGNHLMSRMRTQMKLSRLLLLRTLILDFTPNPQHKHNNKESLEMHPALKRESFCTGKQSHLTLRIDPLLDTIAPQRTRHHCHDLAQAWARRLVYLLPSRICIPTRKRPLVEVRQRDHGRLRVDLLLLTACTNPLI